MVSRSPAFRAFVASLPDERTGAATSPELSSVFDAVVQRAKEHWPQLHVDDEVLGRELASRLPEGASAIEALQRLSVHEVFLVLGCQRGDPAALAALETHYLGHIENQLRGSASLGPHIEEARQALRVRLLVAEGDRPARIAGYRGHGPLHAWLRLAMTRLALNLLAESKREIAVDGDNIAQTAGVSADPEIAILVARHRDDLAACIGQAFAELDGELRTVMRMHFLDGVGVGDIGGLFQVSGRTIQRRIQDARQMVISRTRELLFERCGMATRDLETLMRHLQSDLHISLRRVLADRVRPANK